ncbi:MAG: hypothetical protein HY465_00370 [Deltaproteobacteria bacterium]|nr:hypothetical protein [Deltaproteobacteria bacterium]
MLASGDAGPSRSAALVFSTGFPDPRNYPSSDRFRRALNKNSLEAEGLTWVHDNGPQRNIPDPGEVRVNDEYLTRYGVTSAYPAPFTPALHRQLSAAFATRADYYLEVQNAIPEAFRHIYISNSDLRASLSPIARTAADRAARELGPLMNELYLLQSNPRLPEYLEQLKRDVSRSDIIAGAWEMITHTMTDHCPVPFHTDERDCSLYPIPPDYPAINGMLPWNLTPTDWRLITWAYKKHATLADPVFRPDTVVEWAGSEKPFAVFERLYPLVERLDTIDAELAKSDLPAARKKELEAKRTSLERKMKPALKGLVGSLTSTPLPLHPLFADVSRRIADKADEIAQSLAQAHPDVARHLVAVGRYFRSGSNTDAWEVLRTIIEQEAGEFRIAVSPGTESYWADNTKFAALMWVGIVDRQAQAAVQGFASKMMVDADRLAVEKTTYKGEPSKKGQDTVVVDTMNMLSYAGFLRGFPHGTPGGWNFPNFDYGVPSRKKMVMALRILELRKNAELVGELLGPYAKYVTGFGDVCFVTGHENGHFAGPSRNYPTAKGGTMGSIFGERWGWADEPKADMTSPTSLRIGLEDGTFTLDQAKEIFFTYLSWQWTRLQAEKNFERLGQSHEVGIPLEIGWWYQHGLFRLEGAGNQARPVYNLSAPDAITKEELLKWLRLGEALYLKIVDYQARGDVAGYIAEAQGIANQLPDPFITFVKTARERVKAKRPIVHFEVPYF